MSIPGPGPRYLDFNIDVPIQGWIRAASSLTNAPNIFKEMLCYGLLLEEEDHENQPAGPSFGRDMRTGHFFQI